MLISSSPKGCLRPTGPRSARSLCIRLFHGHTGSAPPRIGPQHHLGPSHACSIVRANVPRDSSEPVQQHPEESTTTRKVSVEARQLLSVTALAFFSLVAVVAKERVTNPIVPPFLPRVDTLTSAPAGASSSKPQPATATVELPDYEASSASTAAAKPSRSLLRALWGTATLPVRLVDALLFPEEPLVGTKQQATAHSTTAQPRAAAQRSQQQPKPAAKAAGPSSSSSSGSSSSSSVLPAADPSAAAAGERLTQLSHQVEALAAAAAPAVNPITTSVSAVLQRLQDALAHAMKGQQGSTDESGSSSAVDRDTAAAAAADTAAVLAVVRMALGPEGMGLLPVLLVTSATAVAGVMLAASMAGLAGLVDSRRAATPAQRAATAALLDSPLRPISCPTWPGFFPMLPSSIEPTCYRWRDTDTPTTDAQADAGAAGDSSTANRTAAAAAAQVSRADATAAAAAKAVQDQPGWWSFAQIAALRMMPLLPQSNTSASAAAGAAASSGSSTVAAAAAGTGAAAAAAVAAAPAAPAAAAGAPAIKGAAAPSNTDSSAPQCTPASSYAGLSWLDVKTELASAAEELDCSSVICAAGERATDSRDVSALLGSAWDLALQLVAVDFLTERGDYGRGKFKQLFSAFGSTAPVEVLAEVCCLLPAAVVRVQSCPEFYSLYNAARRASALLHKLLNSEVQPADRLEAVCAAMGLVGTAAQPRALQGVLQQRYKQVATETAVLEEMEYVLTFNDYANVPSVREWLTQEKQQRLGLVTAGLSSAVIAAFEVAEMCAQREGFRWAEPRPVLQHGVLVEHLQHLGTPTPIGTHLPDWVIDSFLDPSLATAWPAEIHDHEPADDEMFGDAPTAKEVVASELEQALVASELEQALMPVVSPAVSRDDAVCEDTVLRDVCGALEAGVLVVKTSQTQLPFRFRPAWPAALALAGMDWFLLPATSARLQRRAADTMMQGDSASGGQLLAHTLALLPAAVAHVKTYEAALVADPGDVTGEDATSICLRMCSEMLPAAMVADLQSRGCHLGQLLENLGLSPGAVAAALAASAQGDTGVGLQRLTEISGECLLYEVFNSMYEEGSDAQDGEDMMLARPVLMSFTVFLALLLHLASSKGWTLDSAGSSAAQDSKAHVGPDEQQQQQQQQQDEEEGSSVYHLPPWFWADLAALYAEGNVSQVPGGAAAATVLLELLVQAQRYAQRTWLGGTHIWKPPLLDSQFDFACALLCAARDGPGSSSGSSTGAAGHRDEGIDAPVRFRGFDEGSSLVAEGHSWDDVLAAALEPPLGVDYGGDEQWRELQDLQEALVNDALPWDVGTSSIPGYQEAGGEQAEDEEAEDEGSGSLTSCHLYEEECDEDECSSDSDSYSTTATAGGSYAEGEADANVAVGSQEDAAVGSQEADAAVGSQEEFADDFDVPDASADLDESSADNEASFESWSQIEAAADTAEDRVYRDAMLRELGLGDCQEVEINREGSTSEAAGLADSQEVEIDWEGSTSEAAGLGSHGQAAAAAAAAGESSGPSCADIRKMGWEQGWGAPQEPLETSHCTSMQPWEEQRAEQQRQKKLRKKARKKARQQAEQQAAAAAVEEDSSAQASSFFGYDLNPEEAWKLFASDKGTRKPARHIKVTAATAATAAKPQDSKAHIGSPKAAKGAAVQQGLEGSGTQGSKDRAAQGAAQGSQRSTAKGSQRSAVETAAKGGAGSQAELVPTVKKLLGLPVQGSDSTSSTDTADLVPNRLTLLMCQAMLMRGDDAEQRLQAAVGYLAAAEAGKALQLPLMLSGCMEALFSGEDWARSSGPARQVLASLSGALPAQQYMSLQQHLMAKGLLRELEVPAEFEA